MAATNPFATQYATEIQDSRFQREQPIKKEPDIKQEQDMGWSLPRKRSFHVTNIKEEQGDGWRLPRDRNFHVANIKEEQDMLDGPKPSNAKRDNARPHGNKGPRYRQHRGPRPFDPESEAGSVTLEKHIERGVQVTDDGRKHHAKILSSEKATRKRMNHLSSGITVHGTQRNKGQIPKDTAKTIVIYDFKKQEVAVLKAFLDEKIGEESALYLLLEIGFAGKIIGGPAFYRAGLEDAQVSELENFMSECLEKFRKANSATEEDIAFSEETMRDLRNTKSELQRRKNI